MKQNPSKDAIPQATAWQICAEIRQENRGKWYTFNGLFCWGCVRFTNGDLTKMCVSAGPDYRGCAQVNARYDQRRRVAQEELTK